MSRAFSLWAGLAVAALAPAAAEAHSLVRPSPGLVSYISADATSLNTLVVRANGSRIEFRDPTVDGGMDPGDCTPGELTHGFRLTGGPAEDQLSGDDGDDVLAGGAGADVAIGGPGLDEVSGDAGDDDIRVRDGIQDVVRCGDGDDKVDADTLDEVGADCEAVQRTPTPPPAGAEAAGDRVAPRVEVGAAARQHIARSRRIRVFATSTERGFVAASGGLTIDDLTIPLQVVRRPIAVGGAGAELVVTLTAARPVTIRLVR